MRLDAHTHFYGKETLEKLRPVVKEHGLTHYVAIMKDELLSLIPRLDEAGCTGIPFHWIDLSRDDPFSDAPVKGYKVHLRQTPPRKDGPVAATKEHLASVCIRARDERRPLLFHTDGDDPNPSSVPMLAQLCRDFPGLTVIAGHSGVYTQERFQTQYGAEVFGVMLEDLWRLNLRLILRTPGLYGDVTKFGMDYPWRSPDPFARVKTFRAAVASFTAEEKERLCRKLFTGTDFPHFLSEGEDQSWSLRGKGVVERSTIAFQVQCMEEAFGRAFDETRMVEDFLALLP